MQTLRTNRDQEYRMSAPLDTPLWPAKLDHADRAGRMVFVCEHASNRFAAPYGTLGLSDAERAAHIAWDPGALGLARGLAARLGGPLIWAPLSRLIYDCNRAPDAPGAMAERSETHRVPGNCGLSPADRLARVNAVYHPFHEVLRAEVLRRLTLGLAPVIVTVHSFTPVYFGQPRAVEFGVIHDADPTLAHAVLRAARDLPLHTALNQPYSAADQVTHTLRLHATPYDLPAVMLEVRNDLIATPKDEDAMADRLAPLLAEALAAIETGAHAPDKTRTG